MNPLARLHRFLEVAPYSQSTIRVEQIEAYAVGPRWSVGGHGVVHTKRPFVLSGFALAYPVRIAGALEDGECQHIGADPGRNAQLAGRRHAEIRMVGDLDVVVFAIEYQVIISCRHLRLLSRDETRIPYRRLGSCARELIT